MGCRTCCLGGPDLRLPTPRTARSETQLPTRQCYFIHLPRAYPHQRLSRRVRRRNHGHRRLHKLYVLRPFEHSPPRHDPSAQPGARTEPEWAILSPNGQYAFLSQSGLLPKARILNLATGASTPPFDRRFAGNRNVSLQIANNGTAIQTDGLRLWPSGELRPLPVEGCAAINAAATRAYCEAFPRLNLLDIATGRLTPIFTVQQGTVFFSFDISESGDQVAFLDAAGLWLIRSDGTALRRLADADTGVSEFVLSADGNVVFASTTDSRLLRIDIGGRSTAELVPPTPAIRLQPGSGELVKGSVYEYRSASIPEIVQVRLPGVVAPAFHAGPEVIAFQVPFDAPTANGWPELVLASQPSGPFVSSVLPGPVNIVDVGPFWYTQGGPPGSFFLAIAALHQDFRGPVTLADPSVPGEIVHVYGGGFGPVAPTPRSGQPAPESPLSRATQQPLECTLASGAPPRNRHRGHPVRRPGSRLDRALPT